MAQFVEGVEGHVKRAEIEAYEDMVTGRDSDVSDYDVSWSRDICHQGGLGVMVKFDRIRIYFSCEKV